MTDYTAKAILRRYADRLVDGTRILSSDRELIVEANGTYTPAMGDQPLIDGEYWTVQDVVTSRPGGTDLVYFLQVRR